MTPLKRTSPINRTRNLDESVFDEFGEKWAVTLYINTLPISTNPYLDEFGENGSGKWKSLHNLKLWVAFRPNPATGRVALVPHWHKRQNN